MNYLMHLPEGNVFLTREEITERVAAILAACPSEHTNAYRVWYEGFEGCGRPSTEVRGIIDEAIEKAGWKNIGPMRFEKYGVVNPTFQNTHYAEAAKEMGGSIFWVAVVEVFDMRCFEWKDGKYIGQMVEIDPFSDYARQMVEVKV